MPSTSARPSVWLWPSFKRSTEFQWFTACIFLKSHNRGIEVARTAMEMARVMELLGVKEDCGKPVNNRHDRAS